MSTIQKRLLGLGVLLWALGWVLMFWRWDNVTNGHAVPLSVPYFAIVGGSAGLLTLITFGAFYITAGDRSPDESIRTSIAAALVTFYIVIATDLLVVPGMVEALGQGTPATGEAAATASFGQSVFVGLSGFVGVVLAFYFAAAAITDKAKTDKSARMAVAEQEHETARMRLQTVMNDSGTN